MIKYIIILLCFIGNVFCQTNSLIVRKKNKDIIGKTLNLTDLRSVSSGSISFINEVDCQINFSMTIMSNIIIKKFNNQFLREKKKSGKYQVINDTLLIVKVGNYTDTCYYKFIDDVTNVVQFKHTLHGEVIEPSYGIFYDVDSVIYSQSVGSVVRSNAFTDSLAMIDSTFKNITDKKLRKELEKEYQNKLNEYKKTLSFNYFKGRYKLINNELLLFQEDSICFGKVKLVKDGINSQLVPYYDMEGTIDLISQYTHVSYASLQKRYDKAWVKYYHPKSNIRKEDLIILIPIHTDSFNIQYINESKYKLCTTIDTTLVRVSPFTRSAKFKNKVGGYYNTRLKSHNGKEMFYKPLYFIYDKAYELYDDYTINFKKEYTYLISDSVLFVVIDHDTLVDELKNAWKSFSFSYVNNEPVLFGAYSRKNDNQFQFYFFFENGEGGFYTSKTNDYKQIRESVRISSTHLLNRNRLKEFTFTSSEDFLWITYKDGDYEKLELFNFFKGVRNKKGSYYLLN